MRKYKYLDHEALDLQSLADLHVFSPLNTNKWILECRLFVYVFIYVLAPEGLNVFRSYSIFKSLSITGYFSLNMNSLALKIGDIKMGPKSEIRSSPKIAQITSIEFQ
jgi:hypothetical protein